MAKLVTVPEIAASLSIPPATIRRYIKAFAAFMPSVEGEKPKRYRAEALEIVRLISESYKGGRGPSEIEAALAAKYPHEAVVHTLRIPSMDTPLVEITEKTGERLVALLERQNFLLEQLLAVQALPQAQNKTAEDAPGLWKRLWRTLSMPKL